MSRGFSLFEVLVAMAILIGAVVTLAMAIARSAATNASARASTYATILATDKIEHLRALPFDDAGLAAPGADTLASDIEGFFDEPAPGYRRRWSIQPLAAPVETVSVTAAVWCRNVAHARLTTLRVRMVS
jgi:Tfp pilus assembly protein PilV